MKKFSFDKMKNFPMNASTISASLYFDKDSNKYIFANNTYDQDAAAYAKYSPQIDSTGWDFLILSSNIRSTEKYTDYQKSFSMGFLEGILTKDRIWNHYQNMRNYLFFPKSFMPDNVINYLKSSNDYIKKTSYENYLKNDVYWTAAYTIYAQFEGLVEGYNSSVDQDKALSIIDFHTMASFGDLDDISFYQNINKIDFSKMTSQEIINYINKRSHC